MLSTIEHDMADHQRNRERSREGIDNSISVTNTDLVHTGTRISSNNTYHDRESTPSSARHHQTTRALPEAEWPYAAPRTNINKSSFGSSS